MGGTRRIVAIGVALGLVFCQGATGSGPIESPNPTVYAKGLSASIGGTILRPARLVFTDRHVIVDVQGHDSERFDYETIRFQRTRTPVRWSLFDKRYWLSALSGAPLAYLVGPYFMAGYFGAVHVVEMSRWLGSRGERQRLGLHSDDLHRCSQVALPRNKKLRNAILDEFSRRFAGKLQTRAPDSFLAAGTRALSGCGCPGARFHAHCVEWHGLESREDARKCCSCEFLGVMVRALPPGDTATAAAL